MSSLVDQIAASRYAFGLHPVLSMLTLQLYQNPQYDPDRDAKITIDYDSAAGEFVVQYLAGPYRVPFSTHSIESHWTKRHQDGFVALERCLQYLRWFTDDGPTSHIGTS
jgi:hypothetical protein